MGGRKVDSDELDYVFDVILWMATVSDWAAAAFPEVSEKPDINCSIYRHVMPTVMRMRWGMGRRLWEILLISVWIPLLPVHPKHSRIVMQV